MSAASLDLRGLIPATVLPMTEDAPANEAGLCRYMRPVAAAGPKAVAVNVDTGEGQHLWPGERLRVPEVVIDETGDRVPVIAGLSAQFTEQAVKFAGEYRAAGTAGLLVFPIPAYQGRPLDPELPVGYHAAIGVATGLPLVLFKRQPALGGVLERATVRAPLLPVSGAERNQVREALIAAGELKLEPQPA
jgi:4-hydroxy-tetrahydrodipicolinate synthase